MIPNNVRTVRLTAAAGTNLARASSRDRSRLLFSPPRQGFTTRRPSSPTRRRSVELALIAEDPRLQPPVGVWPVLSASGAGRALTPARHLRPGGPLPRQLPNITWASPRAADLWSHDVIWNYPFSRRAMPDPRVNTHALLPLTLVPHCWIPATCMPNPRRQRSF